MDHLPLPSDHALASKTRVPYLGLARYDNGGFHGFPERIGTRESDVVELQRDDDSKDWRLSCLQEWLFFGSLHEFSTVWKVSVDLGSFVETDEKGAAYITTRPLIAFARNVVHANAVAYAPGNWSSLVPSEPWEKVMSQRSLFEIACLALRFGMPQEVQSENQQRMRDFLQKLNDLSLWQPYPKISKTSLQWRIVWSISTLLETLENISRLCFGPQGVSSPRLDVDFVTADMRRGGWCPSRFSQITHLSPSLLYYISLLSSFDHRGHTACTSLRCLEAPLASTTPNPGHDEEKCHGSCAMLGVEESQIVAILAGGDYPVINVCFSENVKPHLEATAAKSSTGYVAISHVW